MEKSFETSWKGNWSVGTQAEQRIWRLWKRAVVLFLLQNSRESCLSISKLIRYNQRIIEFKKKREILYVLEMRKLLCEFNLQKSEKLSYRKNCRVLKLASARVSVKSKRYPRWGEKKRKPFSFEPDAKRFYFRLVSRSSEIPCSRSCTYMREPISVEKLCRKLEEERQEECAAGGKGAERKRER